MTDVLTSKKFWAFVIGVGAVLLLVVLSIFLSTAVTVVAAAIGSITSLVIAHMTNQASVDRTQASSPYFPSGGSYAPGVTMPPPPSTTVTTTSVKPEVTSELPVQGGVQPPPLSPRIP
jgi:hypothetical protein